LRGLMPARPFLQLGWLCSCTLRTNSGNGRPVLTFASSRLNLTWDREADKLCNALKTQYTRSVQDVYCRRASNA
jgi:hypothetical protein